MFSGERTVMVMKDEYLVESASFLIQFYENDSIYSFDKLNSANIERDLFGIKKISINSCVMNIAFDKVIKSKRKIVKGITIKSTMGSLDDRSVREEVLDFAKDMFVESYEVEVSNESTPNIYIVFRRIE